MLLLLAVLLVVCILEVLTTTVDVEDKVKKLLATSLTAVNQEEELHTYLCKRGKLLICDVKCLLFLKLPCDLQSQSLCVSLLYLECFGY